MTQPLIDSFDALRAQLERENLPFKVAADVSNTVSLPTKLGAVDSLLHIRWEGTPGVVQFVQTIPLIVPPSRRADVGALLHRLNHQIAVLGYTFDADKGVIGYRTQAFLGVDKALAPAMVGAMIAVAARTVTENLTDIEQAAGARVGTSA